MPTPKLPNIFRHATRELSQDAMVCWLFEWANQPTTIMGTVGRSFLDLFARKIPLKLDWSRLVSIDVKRQYCRADVVAICHFPEQNVVIIVEDKTEASLSGINQLERNQTAVCTKLRNNGTLDFVPFTFLFKTGYDYDFVPARNYFKINYRDILAWISHLSPRQRKQSDILSQWCQCQHRQSINLQNDISAARDLRKLSKAAGTHTKLDNHERRSRWNKASFQYLFVKRLFRVKEESISQVKETSRVRKIFFRRSKGAQMEEFIETSNSAGRAWTTYWYSDNFYYRLDWVQKIWAISVRFSPNNRMSMRTAERIADDFFCTLKRLRFQLIKLPCRKSKHKAMFAIDPGSSGDLQHLFDIHCQFVKRHKLAFRK